MRRVPVAGWLLALAFLSVADAHAGIYKCRDAEGKVVFADKPCGDPADQPAAKKPARPVATPGSAGTPVPPPPGAMSSVPVDPLVMRGSSSSSSAGSSRSYEKSGTPATAAKESKETKDSGKKPGTGQLALLFTGVGLMFASYIVHIVSAFRAGETVWAVLMLVIAPTVLFFIIFQFSLARKGLGFFLAGMAMVIAGVA